MKKIVRLTESDLTRIVKRVIKEQSEKPDPTKGIASKIVGMIMTATGGAMTDEQKILDAVKLITSKQIYNSVINIIKTSPKVKNQYGKNFNKLIDLIATDVPPAGAYKDPYHMSDQKWFNKYTTLLERWNSDEKFISSSGGTSYEFDTAM